MRIVLVTPVPFSPHSLRPLQGFLAMGHEVILCAPDNPFPEGRERYHFFAHAYSRDSVVPLLHDVKRWFSPHVVHAHFADDLAWHAAQAGIGPLALSVWGSDINEYVEKDNDGYRWRAKSGAKRLFLPELLRCAAHVVVDDASMFAKCRFVAGRDVPMSLIPLGVDISLFTPVDTASRTTAKRALGLSEKTPILFSPRALVPGYGHDVILDAFAALGKNSSAVLLFKKFPNQAPSAAIAQWRKKLHGQAAMAGIHDRILFADEVPPDALPSLYAASDAIVNMPVQDAFPVTFAEAGSMRVPIITVLHEAYVGTYVEECSLHVPLGDIPALTAAMQRAIDGNAVTEDCLDRARASVLSGFSHTAYVEKIEAVSRKCADGGTSEVPAVHVPLAGEPKVGVLIPCYNAARFLPDALRSLQAQEYRNWEAFVVDDCSDQDDPAAVVEAFADPRIHLIRHELNSGQAAGRNSAAAATDAPFLLTLDADDCLHPLHMRILVELLIAGKNDVVFSSFSLFGGESGIWSFPVPASPEELTESQRIPGPGSLFRREVWEGAGGYDASEILRKGNEDWEFWIAAIQLGIKIDAVNLPLYYYRRILNLASHSQGSYAREHLTRAYILTKHANFFEKYAASRRFLAGGFFTAAAAEKAQKNYPAAGWLFLKGLSCAGLNELRRYIWEKMQSATDRAFRMFRPPLIKRLRARFPLVDLLAGFAGRALRCFSRIGGGVGVCWTKLLYTTNSGRSGYWENRAHDLHESYGNSPDFDSPLVEALRTVNSKKVFDIGCNDGRNFPVYEQNGVIELVANDISATAIGHARERAFDGVNLTVGPVENADYPENYFDLAVSVRVLQHIHPKNIEMVLAKLSYSARFVFIDDMTREEMEFFSYGVSSPYLFVHEYKKIMGARGAELVWEKTHSGGGRNCMLFSTNSVRTCPY